RWLQRHPRLVLAVALLLGVAALASIPVLRFDADPLDLQSPKLPPVATALELVNDPETAPSIELLMPDLAEAENLADRLEKLPEVGRVLSLASFVPGDQPAKLDILSQMQLFLGPILDESNQVTPPDAATERAATEHFLGDLKSILAKPNSPIAEPGRHFAEALTRFLALPGGGDVGRLRDTLVGGIEGRVKALRVAMTAGPLTIETMPEEFKSRWLAPDGRARLEVNAKGNIRDPATLARFVDAVRLIAPGATGGPVLILETGRTVSHAFLIASTYALIGITLVLAVMLRRPRDVVLVIVPLILAGLYTLGAIVLLGLAFNYANVIAVPLLMGIGVAFDIYFVMLWRASSGPVALLTTPTARAVVFSACTTAMAFGSLALSHHAGTASMGLLLVIALFFVLVSTLVVQPALMTLVGRGR
ncbi:MAG: MMPL family transporter, partial [Aliidongia sp.]